MNKYQEALVMMCYKCRIHNSCKSKTCNPINILLELVDKATPKKYELKSEMVDGVKWTHAICPNCKEVIDEFEYYPYCPNCGQAVDWSDD